MHIFCVKSVLSHPNIVEYQDINKRAEKITVPHFFHFILLKKLYFQRMNKHIRNFENFHILLWLLKDICWVTISKSMGVIMIIPTLALAIYITIINKNDKSDLAHNLAVCFWICANSTWMIGEFFFDDSLRNEAIVLFLVGLLTMMLYYIPLLFRKSLELKRKTRN